MGRAEELFERIRKEGEVAIDEFIATRATEELFLDFKRSADNGMGRSLHDNDRRNLAKAISGFGNSEGGVIVWGVDCSRDAQGADIARMKFPLIDAQRYKSFIEGAVSSSTIPAHKGVVNAAVVRVSGVAGFVATLIPASDIAPHQVIYKGEYLYYMRAGADFFRVPHMVLAGMFGRRPQANVFNMFNVAPAHYEPADFVQCAVGFVIRNQGPGIATDLFSNVFARSFPDGQSKFEFRMVDNQRFEPFWTYGVHLSVITRLGVRLPPEGYLNPFSLEVTLKPPFKEGVLIEGIAGAAGTMPHRYTFQNSAEGLRDAYEYFVARQESGTLSEADTYDFVTKALGIPDTAGK